MAKTARSQKNRKRGLLIGIGLPLVIALIFLVAFLTRDDSDDTATTSVPTPTVDPVSTDPTATDPTATTECPAADGSSARVTEFAAAPPMCIDTAKTYTAEVTTNFGAYTMELYPDKAPETVNNFVVLARYHYFDDTTCHRAILDFMVQCGDPTATGSGGPGYEFKNENPAAASEYVKGSVSMANAGQDTNGSQFFVATSDQTATSLGEPIYTLFGQVTEGLDTTIAALNALGDNPAAANGVPPLEEIVIQSVTITES